MVDFSFSGRRQRIFESGPAIEHTILSGIKNGETKWKTGKLLCIKKR